MNAIAGALLIALTTAAVEGRAADTISSIVALHTFKDSHGRGAGPDGALVQASDGLLYGTTGAGGFQGNGTLFRIGLDGQFESIAGFALSEGVDPVGDLVDGGDGSLYGVAYSGGEFDGGTIYKTTLDGSKTVLYSFDRGGWGGNPPSGLAAAPDGSFYGVLTNGLLYRFARDGSWTPVVLLDSTTTSRPVVASDGNVYVVTRTKLVRVSPDGATRTIHAFGADKPRLYPASLILGSDGNFYGTAGSGGGVVCGVIYRVDAAGVETHLHDFKCSPQSSAPLAGVVESSDGTLVGTDQHHRSDGTYRYTVWTMATDGSGFVETKMPAHAGSGANTLIQASDGAFYGTAPGGKFGEGTIVKIVP